MKDNPPRRSYNLRVAGVKVWHCPTRPFRKRDSTVREEICVVYDWPDTDGHDILSMGFADEAEAQQWLEDYIEHWKDDPPWFLVKSH